MTNEEQRRLRAQQLEAERRQSGARMEAERRDSGDQMEASRRATGTQNEAARRAIGTQNEASRRAIGTDNESARRAIGTQNESARRAIGTQMESDRQSSGQRMEDSRRAGGDRMIAERSVSTFSDDLSRLVDSDSPKYSLPELEARGGIASMKGIGVYDPKNAPQARGIASPLREPDFKKRVYWPGGTTSSDGLFTVPNIKRLVLVDANGAQVIVDFPNPNPPTAP